MFYSQFILAKKGPLGTIWIAAHLERKLRKNQVTETNIGVSVDSIMFPEVPIALRLSGHLLLGVVRIYSRKVNYLFHDCSEALVKIKQAFHSGTVDLPPESASAPFNSITLPESFDLDDLELLPDQEAVYLANNNSTDHHVTAREQITLQESVGDDDLYLTSQFGLDERFPEDGPRFDFDEDVFYIKDLHQEKETEEENVLPEDAAQVPDDDECGRRNDEPDIAEEPSERNPPSPPQFSVRDEPSAGLDINLVPEDHGHLEAPEVEGNAVSDPAAAPAVSEPSEQVVHPEKELDAVEPVQNVCLPLIVQAGTGTSETEEAEQIEAASNNVKQNNDTDINQGVEHVPDIEMLRSAVDAEDPGTNPLHFTPGGFQNDIVEGENEKSLTEDKLETPLAEEASLLKPEGLTPPSAPPAPALPELSDLPADDDLLATILGRRASSLRVAPTPSDAPPAKRQKPGPKPGTKKRRFQCDDSTVLHGDTMRQQLSDTSDIRRVKRRVPTTEYEMWVSEKETHGQHVFNQPLLSGVGDNLRELYHCVYGVSETKLSELSGKSHKKTLDKHQLESEETNETLSLAEDPYDNFDLPYRWADEDVGKTFGEEDVFSIRVTSGVDSEEKGKDPKEGDDQDSARVNEDADTPAEEVAKVAEATPSEAKVPGEDETKNDGAEIEVVCKEVEAVADTETQDHAAGSPQMVAEAVETMQIEPSGEEERAMAVPDEELLPSPEPETAATASVDETGTKETPTLSKPLQPTSPVQAQEELFDEPAEALEFLVDTKDADENCDEEYEEEDRVQDSTGWSVRTRAVCQYLRYTFESMEASRKQQPGGKSTTRLGLERLLQGKTRREAARMFFETLVLKSKDYINVEQSTPFDNIYISSRAKLMKADL